VNYPDSGNNLIFVKIPYDSVNEHESVIKSILKNDYIPYSDFISDDSAYWKAEASSLPKDITGAISTKYDGFELSESIAKAYAITRYCISAMGLIENVTATTHPALTNVSAILDQSSQELTTSDSSSSSIRLNIYQYYRAIKEVYEYYLFSSASGKENFSINSMSSGYAIASEWPSSFGESDSLVASLIENINSVFKLLLNTDSEDVYKKAYAKIISSMSKTLLDMSEVMKSASVSGLSFVDRIEFYMLGLYGIKLLQAKSSDINNQMFVYMRLMAEASSDSSSFSNISIASKTDFGIIYSYLIYPMIRLPVDYYGNGILNQSSDFFISYKAWKLIEDIMEKIYISGNLSSAEKNRLTATFSGNETVSDSNSKTLLSVFLGSDISNISSSDVLSKLSDMISDAETIAENKDGMIVSYSTKNNSDNAVSFVTKAIEMFISYTSQIYDIRMYKSYDTKSECVPISENIVHSHSSVKSESVSYDESVTIAKMA
jgi:hypothetical protein